MTLKLKATRVAALSLLLAPMALSTFQGVSNVYATGNNVSARLPEEIPEGKARLHINKRQFETMPDEDKQNLGTEMLDFGGKPLAGVTFEVWDISDTVFNILAHENNYSREDIAKATVVSLSSQGGATLKLPDGEEIDGSIARNTPEVTTDKFGVASIDVAKIHHHYGIDAAYLIVEVDHPANVIQTAAPMIVQFPVYEMNADGTYTDNLLDEIYLYPKNLTGSGDILVNKVVQSTDGYVVHNGAKFVVKRIVDGDTEYMGPVDDTTGVRTWGGRPTAEEFTTTGNGQVSIPNIPRSSTEAETFYLEEIDTGNEEDITIPEQNKNLEFELDGVDTEVGGIKYDFIFQGDDAVFNNDLVPEKTVSDIVLGNGESVEYKVAFNVPIDIDWNNGTVDDPNYKYNNFFLLDEHHEALSMENFDSIKFLDESGKEITDWNSSIEYYTLKDDFSEIYDMYHAINGEDRVPTPIVDLFAIRWNSPAETLSDYAGERITVQYEMKLIETDVADIALLNTATIHTGYENDSSETEVFTDGKQFVKVDANTGAELEGAKFYVTDADGQALYLDEDGLYTWAAAPASADFEEGNVPDGLVVLTSDADGVFEIQGLDYDGVRNEEGDIIGSTTYTLMEFAAPSDRYILPDGGFDFVVSYGSYGTEEVPGVAQEVENKAKGTLPMTGGTGTIVFFLVGAATMAGAAYVVRKNKKTA